MNFYTLVNQRYLYQMCKKFFFCFVSFDALPTSKHLFSHVGVSCLPGLNQYYISSRNSVLHTNSAGGESLTSNPSILSLDIKRATLLH